MDIYVAFNFGYCKYWNEPGQGWGGSFQITIFFPLDKYPLVSLVDHDIWQKLEKAAAAKSLQSCPTLCDPIDSSPPGSPIPGILQARTLEWVAISFSNAWKWKNKVKSLSRVQLLETPWTARHCIKSLKQLTISSRVFEHIFSNYMIKSRLRWLSIQLSDCFFANT